MSGERLCAFDDCKRPHTNAYWCDDCGCKYQDAHCAWGIAGHPQYDDSPSNVVAHYNAQLKKAPPTTEPVKYNAGKPQYHLIDGGFLDALAECLTWGLGKYAAENYRGLTPDVLYDSMMRHLRAHQRGEGCDAESGKPHLHHFATNAMMFFVVSKKEIDQ